MAELEQENALLVSQIEEMANERAERDALIEEFGSAVEARIVEWKVLNTTLKLNSTNVKTTNKILGNTGRERFYDYQAEGESDVRDE